MSNNHMENKDLIDICKRIKIDTMYQYSSDEFYKKKMNFLARKCKKVLDIGKGSRNWFKLFRKNQIETMDIIQYKDYPDIIDDICNLRRIQPDSYDGIICRAILEHVYSPESAIKNLHKILKEGGYLLLYVPFLYRYHAPKDLSYQDFFRFTKDGLAYLLRDFSEVTLYPIRGKYSTMLNLSGNWKNSVEKKFGSKINIFLDRIFRNKNELIQVSGYNVWARK
ncbi:MAG: class I SAM-dependent methyltransferase [Candidatus Helarchaeota archaeon]